MPSAFRRRSALGQPRDRGRGVAYRVMMASMTQPQSPLATGSLACDRRPRRASQPEPRPARGRRARCRRRARRSAAGDRRRGLGQDQHAGAPRRAPDRRRRRPRAHPAAHLHAPRRGGNGTPCAPHPRRGRGGTSCAGARAAAVVRHLPRHRRAAAARPRRAHRPRSGFHHPRPRGFGGPAEPGAPRARPVEHAPALSAEGHLPGDLFRRREYPRAAARGAAGELSVVRGLGRGAEAAVPRLRRGQAGAAGARLRRPAAVLGADGRRARARRRDRRPVRPRAGRRVPGHQPPAGRDPAGDEARRSRPHRGGRRRAVDLRLPRRHGAQHPRFPAPPSRRRRRW